LSCSSVHERLSAGATEIAELTSRRRKRLFSVVDRSRMAPYIPSQTLGAAADHLPEGSRLRDRRGRGGGPEAAGGERGKARRGDDPVPNCANELSSCESPGPRADIPTRSPNYTYRPQARFDEFNSPHMLTPGLAALHTLDMPGNHDLQPFISRAFNLQLTHLAGRSQRAASRCCAPTY
jgi:hypothetical protein